MRGCSILQARRLFLALTLIAATFGLQANDTPLLIEFNQRDSALPAAVNATGTVAVGNLSGGGGFYWMPTTGAIYIGGYLATDVSLDGRTIVGTARDPRGIQQAAIWVRGTEWRLLGGFRPDSVPCIDSLSSALATSDDGRVIVGYANAGPMVDTCDVSNSHAFRWEESTGMVDLGSTVATQSSQAKGISGDGKVVVGYQRSARGEAQGARWVDGRQELIPPASGSPLGYAGTAHAANRDGSIVVGEICRPGTQSPTVFQAAWIWTARDGTQCLQAPQPFVSDGVSNDAPVIVRALATSEDGRIVVGEQGIGATDTEAIIWIDRTPQYLKDYLRANGIPNAFARWIRTGSLSDVSPDGRILVGNGAPIGGYNGYVVILGENP
jgi:probable HAF family extracellular repeat protein